MEARPGHNGEPRRASPWPNIPRAEIGALIQAGAYEELERLLETGRDGGDAAHTHILDAATQLCRTCVALRQEQQYQDQATQRVAHLEEDIGRRIVRLLEPMWVISPAAPGRPSPAESALPARWQALWRRVVLALRPPRPDMTPSPPEARDEPAPAISTSPVAAGEQELESVVVEPVAEPIAEPVTEPEAEPPVERTEEPRPAFTIFCLGAFRVYGGDLLIDHWPSRKGKSIFQFFLLNRESPVSKEILMETFWPDGDPADTRRNLHQAIYSLRQSLRQNQPDLQPIIYKQDTYLLNPEVALWLDFEEFERHARAGRRHEAVGRQDAAMEAYKVAVSLYQGDFLEEDLYEDWPATRRDDLRRLFIDAANRLAEYYREQTECTAAMALSRAILTKDNCHEEAHRRLMLCYAAIGQRHLAVRQYQTCVQALRDELDLSPSEATETLYRTLAT